MIAKLGGRTKSDEHRQSIELFLDSTILPRDQPYFGEKLNEWVGCQNDQKWKLIYKGSRDGFKGMYDILLFIFFFFFFFLYIIITNQTIFINHTHSSNFTFVFYFLLFIFFSISFPSKMR